MRNASPRRSFDFAQDFGSRLRRREKRLKYRSLALLGISPAGSRYAHARKTAQVRIPPSPPLTSGPLIRVHAKCLTTKVLRLRSGFRLAAQTPRKTPQVQIPRVARDFACGLPLRSRPQNGSSSNPTLTAINFWSPYTCPSEMPHHEGPSTS